MTNVSLLKGKEMRREDLETQKYGLNELKMVSLNTFNLPSIYQLIERKDWRTNFFLIVSIARERD